jgi:ferredoxin
VDLEKCMGCGVCVSRCTNDALSLSLAPEKGEPLNIIELIENMAEI